MLRCGLRHGIQAQEKNREINRKTHRWHAQINIKGKMKHLGNYQNEEEAFNAYCSELDKIGDPILEW